jgi:hypothetical protein
MLVGIMTEEDVRKGGGIIGPMEMGVNIPGIEGGVEGRLAPPIAKALLGLSHEREEVADVGLIEGLGQFSQHEFIQFRHFDHDETRAVASVELAHLGLRGRDRIGLGCRRLSGRHGDAIVAALAA